MSRIIAAFPTYRHIPANWFFQWLRMDKRPVIGTVGVDGAPLPRAMDKLVEMAFANCGREWDRLVSYEQDMIPPPNGFTLIDQYPDDLDIVGSVYFKHDHPFRVMAWMQTNPPEYSHLSADTIRRMVDKPSFYAVDAVAMGFTAIHRRVFENWDTSIPMWHAPSDPRIAGNGHLGHDLWFCQAAKLQGFNVWLDSGLGCAHLTEVPIGMHHNQQAATEVRAGITYNVDTDSTEVDLDLDDLDDDDDWYPDDTLEDPNACET